jgi:hypothetical protein
MGVRPEPGSGVDVNVQEHPNMAEYLTRFLLNVQKHAIIEETQEFRVEIREGEDEIREDLREMLR